MRTKYDKRYGDYDFAYNRKATVTGITMQIKLDIRFLLPIVEVKFVIVCSSVRLANIPSGSM